MFDDPIVISYLVLSSTSPINIHLKSYVFCPISARPSRGAHDGIVQCHLRHVYGLRAYDFLNLYNFSRNKIVEAAAPVNPYENLTVASASARKGEYGQDTGSVDPSQVKCKRGITYDWSLYRIVMAVTVAEFYPQVPLMVLSMSEL